MCEKFLYVLGSTSERDGGGGGGGGRDFACLRWGLRKGKAQG